MLYARRTGIGRQLNQVLTVFLTQSVVPFLALPSLELLPMPLVVGVHDQ